MNNTTRRIATILVAVAGLGIVGTACQTPPAIASVVPAPQIDVVTCEREVFDVKIIRRDGSTNGSARLGWDLYATNVVDWGDSAVTATINRHECSEGFSETDITYQTWQGVYSSYGDYWAQSNGGRMLSVALDNEDVWQNAPFAVGSGFSITLDSLRSL